MYHAAPGSAFTAIGALSLAFISWGSFIVVTTAVYMTGNSLLVAVGCGQLVMLVVPAIAAKITKRTSHALGLARPRARYLLAALLLGSTVWSLNLALVELLSLPDDDAGLQAAIDTPPLLLVLLVIVVAPAICEEVLFRGVILRGFASRLVPAAAVVLSALLFSIYHLNLVQAVPTFTLGIVLAVLSYRAGSAIPAMLAHALNNGIVVLLFRGELPFLANSEQTGILDRQPVIGLVVAAVLALAGLTLAITGERTA